MPGHWLRRFEKPPPPPQPNVPGGRIRFLGTAGFEFAGKDGTRVLVDPYLSRPGLAASLTRPLPHRFSLLRRELPEAAAVLCGHSHHDHALDAPEISRYTGAPLVGSASTRNLGIAAGLQPEQLVNIEETEQDPSSPRSSVGSLRIGEVTASALPSRHGTALFGHVPLPGSIDAPPPWPPRMIHLRHGAVYLWHLDLGDATVLHVDTADWFDSTLLDVRADILCLCAVGRQYRPGYTEGIISRVRPTYVIPCHWDDFTLPWEAPPRQLPGVDLGAFCDEIRACGSEPVLVGMGKRWSW